MTFEGYHVLLTTMAVLFGFFLAGFSLATCVFGFDYRTLKRTKILMVIVLLVGIIFEFQLVRGAFTANDLNRVYGSGSSFDTVENLNDFNERLEILNQEREELRQRKAMSHDG